MLLNIERQPISLYKQNICLVWVLFLRSKGKQLRYQLFPSSEVSLILEKCVLLQQKWTFSFHYKLQFSGVYNFTIKISLQRETWP